jgi:hypothetical protein
MDDLREEDYELSNIREFFELWIGYELDLRTAYTTVQIIEAASPSRTPNDYSPQAFKQFLLRVASAKNVPDTVSAERLGWWLHKISGRIVRITDTNGAVHRYRLIKGQGRQHRACFRLLEV